ncbi:MAG: homoserine dehydrogenase [Bacteroidetes bacterium]|nr:homoserine dehydrogenase [Bacteroidota bacterium]
MQRKKLTIGLFGFGCVGYGLYQVLERTPTLNATIKTICVKDRHKQRPIPSDRFTFDREDILGDSDINVIVELIDNADEAFEIVSTALRSGRAVVTANKKMIAEHLAELIDLQRTHGVPLLYEASCCASIPILRNLEEYYDNDLLESVEGIVNGSTNYILTKMATEGLSYDTALKQAQEKGYAESNPLLDTGGFDAKYKLLILAAHAFGGILKPSEIFNAGIDRITPLDQQYAREKGLKVKLLARAFKKEDGTVSAFVSPHYVAPTDRLYQVDDVYNGVTLKTVFSEDQFFSGKGAGAYPTASAVISDLSALTYDYKYEYKKINHYEHTTYNYDTLLKVYASSQSDYQADVADYFEEVWEQFSNGRQCYNIGTISLRNYARLYAEKPVSLIVIDRHISEVETLTAVDIEALVATP